MGGAWRSEHLTGEAVLEFHHLLVDDDLPGARGGAIAGVSRAVCRKNDGKTCALTKVQGVAGSESISKPHITRTSNH